MNSTLHNTLDCLKAFMVAPFVDMPGEEITLAVSRYRYRIKRVTKAEVGFFDFFYRYIVYASNAVYKNN